MTEDINETMQAQALAQLVEELGINTLPKEKQDELIIKMTEVLLKRIFIETMDQLGVEGREEYETMMQGENVDPQQVEAFLKERINNYEELVRKVIEEFREEMTKTQAE